MAYMGIPVALALGRRDGAPVVYDARDIYMEARSMARRRGLARWALAAAERRWARRASSVITVNDDYADEMARRLRVTRPLVVMNCSYRFDPPRPRERRFHDLLQLDASTHVVLYHGGLFPERGIEQLMEAILEVPDAVLVLMGYGVLEADLRVRAAEPRYAGRVHLVPPVEPQELHPWIACADIGAMLIQPTTLNHRLTTPNKLFESMAAGVPVVVSDVPGMARIVKETGIGAVCDGTDPTSISEALRQLLADPTLREVMGRRALAAAHASYNWDRQAKRLLHEYERLTGKPW
jgi:glycosyltransferase involved in cell wall biosynthesis